MLEANFLEVIRWSLAHERSPLQGAETETHKMSSINTLLRGWTADTHRHASQTLLQHLTWMFLNYVTCNSYLIPITSFLGSDIFHDFFLLQQALPALSCDSIEFWQRPWLQKQSLSITN